MTLSVAIAFSLHSHAAHAQTADAAAADAGRQADILQRQQQERIQRDIDNARPADNGEPGFDTRQLKPKVDASAAGPSCHHIETIHIDDAPHLDVNTYIRILERYQDRCLGVPEIEEILAAITRAYIDGGWVTTRAYLRDQDLTQGELTIDVVEGRIGGLTVDDGDKHSINTFMVMPGKGVGGLLNLRDLEQAVEQINKLSSNDAKFDIAPGQEPGTSDVIIHNKPVLPLHASVSADNQGSRSTGRNQTGASVVTDHLLGLNEMFIYTHRQSQPNNQDTKYSDSDSLTALVPFGYSTLSYSHSRSAYVSSLVAPSGLVLQFRGDSSSDVLRHDRVVYRNGSTRVNITTGLTLKENHNYLQDQLLEVSSRKLSILDIGVSLSTLVANGVASLDLGIQRGLDFAGALKDASYLNDTSPRAQFRKFTAGASYLKSFKLGELDASFQSQFTGQISPDTLYGSEQMLIGGWYTVRGFLDTTLSGDQGYYVRNDFSLRPRITIGDQVIALRTYLGIDFGRVSNHVANIPDGRLSGMALGVATYWKACNIEVAYARPLQMPAAIPRETGQLWLRASIGF